MTDAQIALYAAVRVAIPTSWRVRILSSRYAKTLIVECTRHRNHRIERLAHAVPAEILADPRYTVGTIGIDVRQIVDDLACYGTPRA